MNLDNSNKRYSIIIAGILVLAVLSIAMAFLIGYGDNSIYEQNKSQLILANPFNSDHSLDCCKGDKKIESVTQSNSWDNVDVEEGDVTLISAPWDVCGFDMPIYVDYDVIDDWSLTFEVYGNYHPSELLSCGSIAFYQLDKNDQPDGILNDIIYYLDPSIFVFTDITVLTDPVGYKYYTLTFDVDDTSVDFVEVDDLDESTVNELQEYMLFDSNHKPVGRGWCKLDKEVSIDLVTCWAGCGCQSQEFEVILIQKNNISGVPNSRVKFFIAS